MEFIRGFIKQFNSFFFYSIANLLYSLIGCALYCMLLLLYQLPWYHLTESVSLINYFINFHLKFKTNEMPNDFTIEISILRIGNSFERFWFCYKFIKKKLLLADGNTPCHPFIQFKRKILLPEIDRWSVTNAIVSVCVFFLFWCCCYSFANAFCRRHSHIPMNIVDP